jgi:3-hydroxybutyrate dehydrogenase
MQNLEGKVAIVTGAASGIGLAVARDFARHGVRVTLSDIDVEKGRAVASELAGARFQKADMANGEALQLLVAETIAAEGQVDILVEQINWSCCLFVVSHQTTNLRSFS